MDSRTRKRVRRNWKGRSYRKGGEIVRDLRDAQEADAHPTDQAEINANAEIWLEEYLRESTRRQWEAKWPSDK